MLKPLVFAALGVAALSVADREWKATISGRNGSELTGSAEVDARGNDSTRIELQLKNGGSEKSYLWHIHRGSCDAGGEIFGMAALYPEARTSDGGSVNLDVVLNLAPPSEGSYSIHVHGKPAVSDTAKVGPTLACGDLKKSD